MLDTGCWIEAPRSKLRGIFDRKEVYHFRIRSLTPQQAAGNALAFAVQGLSSIKNPVTSIKSFFVPSCPA
jgi:hypothetical protein